MQVDVLDSKGKVLRTIDLDDRVFGIRPNEAVVHQAVVTQQANARQGTHDTKTRAEVAGGGKKPYRQKGTGNARQGSIRAPHYRTGGVVFGPHPRSYEKAMPKKMRHLALRSVLSARAAEQGALIVVDSLAVEGGKTKALLHTLGSIGAPDGALVVLGQRDDQVLRAARNLDVVHTVTPNGMNLLDMLRLPRLILDTSAIEQLTRTLTRDLTPAVMVQAKELKAAEKAAAMPKSARAPKREAPPAKKEPAPKTARAPRARKVQAADGEKEGA